MLRHHWDKARGREGRREGWNYVGRKVAYGNRGARKSSVMFDASRRGKKGLKCSRDEHEGTYGSGEGVEETASVTLGLSYTYVRREIEK